MKDLFGPLKQVKQPCASYDDVIIVEVRNCVKFLFKYIMHFVFRFDCNKPEMTVFHNQKNHYITFSGRCNFLHYQKNTFKIWLKENFYTGDISSKMKYNIKYHHKNSQLENDYTIQNITRKVKNWQKNAKNNFFFFFFSFRPFPLVRGGHSVSSFSTSFCLQCPSPSHQLPSYLLLAHLKIFSLVSLFSSFLVTPFPSSFLLHTLGLFS